MNNERRKRIGKIRDHIHDLKTDLENIRDEEQQYFDNMPESLQGSENGQKSERVTESIETAIDSLDEAIGEMDECIN